MNSTAALRPKSDLEIAGALYDDYVTVGLSATRSIYLGRVTRRLAAAWGLDTEDAYDRLIEEARFRMAA